MHSTDHRPGENRDGTNISAGDVLTAVADYLTRCDPTHSLTEDALRICIGAGTYDLAGLNRSGMQLFRQAWASAPARREGITRGEYAVQLRCAAKGV